MIKNVIFDAGDLLFKSTEYRMGAFESVLRQFKISVTKEKLKTQWDIARKTALIGKESHNKALENFFRGMGINKDMRLAFAIFKDYYSSGKYKLYRGVIPTLKHLKSKGFKTGILTDTVFTGKNRRALYNKLKMGRYIDKVASSHDIHAAKPNPKAFSTILKMMHAKKQNSVFVAHAKDEIDGAKRFGLTTIGFNLDKGAKADFSAKNFSDIIKIIGELNA